MECNSDATGWHLRGCDDPKTMSWKKTKRGPFARPRRGPRSLAVMALEHVVHNIGQLSPEHIQSLSTSSIQQLRMLLCSRGELSLHAWKMLVPFLPALGGCEDVRAGEWAFRVNCPWQQGSLSVFTSPLCSPTVTFVAHLRIVVRPGEHLDAGRLLVLAAMPNLGMLEIITDEKTQNTAVNDRLIRAWSLRPDAFPRLRLLRLWGCGSALTPASLPFANRLASLVVFDVGVGNYREAGWNRSAARTTSAELGWKRFVTEYGLKRDCEEYREWVTCLVRVAQGGTWPDEDEEEQRRNKQKSARSSEDSEALELSAPLWLYDFLSEYGSKDLYEDSPTRPIPPTRLPMATLILDNEWLLWLNPGEDARQITFVRTRPLAPSPDTELTAAPVSTGKRQADNDSQPRLRKTRKGVSAGEMLASLGG